MAERKGKELEISIPVNIIWDDVLMVSLSGVIDSKVAQSMTETILEKIDDVQARMIVLDILSVETLDSAVANHIIKITRITELMGCTCVISGVSGNIAMNIVNLGISLGDVVTRATLKDALQYALGQLGWEVKRK